MGNLILGRFNEEMQVNRFECYVGGLPSIRKKPFEYKAPFSPVDVIEEYTRPARLKENGVIVTKPALSDRHLMNFDGIGTLEAFNTEVRGISAVEECHMIAGNFDYLLKVRTRNMEEYRRVLGEQISALPHVLQTSTFVVMENVKDTGI